MHKLVIMSVDALFTEDLADACHLPAFREILGRAAIYKDMYCVYPTLTYPCHTTILTGMWPKHHGVPHNERLAPTAKKTPWYWEYDSIKAKTIFDYAHEAGLTCAAFEWPVTWRCGERIDWCVPEIVPHEPGQTSDDVFATGCSPAAVHVYEANKGLLDYEYPQFDEFFVTCAEQVIRESSPDVICMHQVMLDHTRHEHGIHCPEIARALELHDGWIGRIIALLKEQGTYDDTVFVILGDHGQIEVANDICPNVLLAQAGLIDVNEDGEVTGWRAFVHSSGISAQLFIAPDAPDGTLGAAMKALRPLMDRGLVSDVFTLDEVRERFHEDGAFAMMFEAARTYAFANAASGELVRSTDNADYKSSVATHGHLPFRGERPPFIVAGPGVTPGLYAGGRMIDEAPTMLDLAGIPFDRDAMDGESLVASGSRAVRLPQDSL